MNGRVVSIKMNQTAVVIVTRVATHPLYKKSFTRSKKYLVDDQLGLKLGDIVEVEKIRPISKRKHWRAVKVVGRSIEEMVSEQLQEAASEAIAEVMPEEVEEEIVEAAAEVAQEEQKGEIKEKKSKVKASKK